MQTDNNTINEPQSSVADEFQELLVCMESSQDATNSLSTDQPDDGSFTLSQSTSELFFMTESLKSHPYSPLPGQSTKLYSLEHEVESLSELNTGLLSFLRLYLMELMELILQRSTVSCLPLLNISASFIVLVASTDTLP